MMFLIKRKVGWGKKSASCVITPATSERALCWQSLSLNNEDNNSQGPALLTYFILF